MLNHVEAGRVTLGFCISRGQIRAKDISTDNIFTAAVGHIVAAARIAPLDADQAR